MRTCLSMVVWKTRCKIFYCRSFLYIFPDFFRRIVCCIFLQTADAGSVHWTFGACFEHEQACLEERYNIGNITQITGIELASLYPGSFDFAILEGLVLPSVGSMNCHELCNCLSCGHGHCSDEEDQDKCPGNKYGFICRCSNSPSYPNLKAIVSDMLSSGNACRHCSN